MQARSCTLLIAAATTIAVAGCSGLGWNRQAGGVLEQPSSPDVGPSPDVGTEHQAAGTEHPRVAAGTEHQDESVIKRVSHKVASPQIAVDPYAPSSVAPRLPEADSATVSECRSDTQPRFEPFSLSSPPAESKNPSSESLWPKR